jgi:sulfite exporter TauE/SafE
MKVGARWGVGHSAGVGVIGLLSLWMRDLVPLDLFSTWGERLVGVTLVCIGAWALRKALRIHAHEHEHDGGRHVHLHAHPGHSAHESAQAHHHHSHAAFGIGLLHGVAGSSHFFGVLPILAFPSRSQALAYLGAFAVGTIASMAAFSWIMGWLAARCRTGGVTVYRGLMSACACAALAVGCFWLVH